MVLSYFVMCNCGIQLPYVQKFLWYEIFTIVYQTRIFTNLFSRIMYFNFSRFSRFSEVLPHARWLQRHNALLSMSQAYSALPSSVSQSTINCVTRGLKAISSASHSHILSHGHILCIGHMSQKLQLLQTTKFLDFIYTVVVLTAKSVKLAFQKNFCAYSFLLS